MRNRGPQLRLNNLPALLDTVLQDADGALQRMVKFVMQDHRSDWASGRRWKVAWS